MKNYIQIIALLITVSTISQVSKKTSFQEIEVNSLIKGTLFSPNTTTKETKLVILIAGSGPTDRNGNSNIGGVNNSLKFLAESLSQNGIAVFSYDKRILSQIASNTVDEKNLSFEDFIKDAKDVITFFNSQKKYSKIIIAGHSEGSLIGMLASNAATNGYISIAGAGRSIDQVLSEQIAKNAPTLKDEVDKGLANLKNGKTFENKNILLASLFRASVQPYMISWIKYNPIIEIKKLNVPILIINGTKDLQVPINDAKLLHAATSKSELKIIDNMNHIFKEIQNDDENIKSYSNPNLPIMTQLTATIKKFIAAI